MNVLALKCGKQAPVVVSSLLDHFPGEVEQDSGRSPADPLGEHRSPEARPDS